MVTDVDEFHGDISPGAVDADGDAAATPSAGAGFIVHMSQSVGEQGTNRLPCAVQSCKNNYATCFHHYLHQRSFNFEVRDGVFCCAMKACCSKLRVGNQGPTTRWDSDGPNGPNTALNSELFLTDWWTTGDNWCVYHGGKNNVNGKTTTMKKEQT